MEVKNRKLNPIERFCFNLNQNGAFNCQMEGEFEGKLPKEILCQAVKIIQNKHYFLNVSIHHDDKYPEFIYNPNLEIPITYIISDDWLAIAEAALNRNFESKDGYLCTVIYVENLNNFHLIITLDHTIADGISGMLLFDDLIFICDQLIKGESLFSIEPIPEATLSENNLPKSGRKELQFFAPPRPPLEGEFYAPIEQRYTYFLPLTLSRDNTQRLTDECKKHDVSVHAGISAILLLTLANEMRNKSKIKPLIDLVAPINLRKFFSPPIANNQLGMGALQMKTLHQIEENSDLWDIAKDVYEKIQGVINEGEIFIAHKELFTLQGSTPEKTYRDRERKVPYVTLSNAGRIDFGVNLHHIIPKRVNFTAQMKNGQGTQWGLFFTGLTASFNNQLVLNLHYLHPYWDRKRAEEFKADLLLNFENL